MTTTHLSEAELNDHAEGRLAGDQLARTERHLAECVQCRGLAHRMGALLDALSELPRELDPEVDLLPSIRTELRRRAARHGPGPRAASRWNGWREAPSARAAAAVALIAIGATFTISTLRSTGGDGAADVASDPATAAADGERPDRLDGLANDDGAPIHELRRLEAEYARATADLLAAFRDDRDQLGPGTARLIEDNIRTIDRALWQSKRALSTEPDSPVLFELVLAAHRQRLDVLRRAAVIAAGS